MIGQFPKFSSLSLEQSNEVAKFYHPEHHYSDFNFLSMYSWDIDGKTRISEYNGGLAIILEDYLTGEPFMAFSGQTRTIDDLITYASENHLPAQLQLVPESVIQGVNEAWLVEEMHDHADYIYDLQDLALMAGNRFAPKRGFINRFLRNYDNFVFRRLDLNSDADREDVSLLLQVWRENKSGVPESSGPDRESIALNRLIQAADSFDLVAFGIYVDDRMVGFSIDECVPDSEYVVSHFIKGDDKVIGVYPLMMKLSAQEFVKMGKTLFNYEQDLGLPGLRKSKLSYNPKFLLKKYKVSPKPM